MKSGGVKILAVVVVVLFGVLYALNTARNGQPDEENELLFPELKARLNDLESVTVTDTDGRLTIVREDDAWRVREKDGYPAATATLRQVLLAIAEARKIEKKTANPELYERLGVQDPAGGEGEGEDESEAEGDSVLVEGSGADLDFAVILGDAAQGDFRYARLPAEEQSWLIDRNPDLPDDAAGWLDDQVVDIAAGDVRSVEIRHADGETIRILKDTPDAGTFTVEGIPEGRELSYPTVVNGIAGTLAKLTLEDVASDRPGAADSETDEADGADSANVVFTTFDGLRVHVTTSGIDDATWITLEASVVEPDPAQQPPADDATNGDADPAATDAAQDPADATGDQAEAGNGEPVPEEEDAPSPAERAATINERTDGWRYRIAGYKADQLTRRWEDLLAEPESESESGESESESESEE